MAKRIGRTSRTLSIEVSQPRPSWSRSITFDAKAFFKSLAKVAVKGIAGQWTDAIAELPELAISVGLDTPVEDRAWILIRRALARAGLSEFLCARR